MEPSELLALLVERLEQLGVAYFVTGSMATIIYGEPRFTNDIDVVIELGIEDVGPLCLLFPAPDFYRSETAVKTAVENRHQFNIIHPASGLKVDVMVPENSEFNKSRFQRRRKIAISEGTRVWFASPEDVILKKLAYYQQGGSDKHIRDILGVLKIQGDQIDLDYIQDWAEQMNLTESWSLVRSSFDKHS